MQRKKTIKNLQFCTINFKLSHCICCCLQFVDIDDVIVDVVIVAVGLGIVVVAFKFLGSRLYHRSSAVSAQEHGICESFGFIFYIFN